MKSTDARIDAYIAKAPAYAQPILSHVRALVHRACPEVEETIKWSRPFFDYKGTMVMLSAFQAHCTVGFWRPEIRAMISPEGNAHGVGQLGRVTSLKDLPTDAKLIGYFKAAAKLNASGVKVVRRAAKPKSALAVPPYFQKALKAHPPAGKAFAGFPPGKQREYIEWLTEAKTEPTREKRLATALEWIAEGKGRNWKYQKS